MTDEKKNIFDNIINALTDRDEKEAAAKAEAEAKAAAEKAAAEAKAAAEKAAAEKAAAAKAAAEKAAAARKAAAEKAAAARQAAAKRAAAERATAKMKAALEKAKAEREAAEAAKQPKKGIVQVRSLFIRADHTTKSEGVGGLVYGNEVEIFETFVDGDDTWARIGENQWAAMIYNGETYIKIEE